MTGRALVVQGDALRLPLPDESVDLCVTSPPYLWKRKYAITHPGEIGNEPNWQLYLENLWAVTDEMLRVLKPTGSIFVDLGDTRVTGREAKWLGIPVKSRLLLPERYRVGCQDRYAAQGVIVRQVQVWEKANGLPESTVDRTRDSHEDVVMLVKSPRYYAALDTLREPHQYPNHHQLGKPIPRDNGRSLPPRGPSDLELHIKANNPLGKLPGSVWPIPSDPLRLPLWLGVDHYAAWPPELPRRLILGWSPPGICCECGDGRRPVVDRQRHAYRLSATGTYGSDAERTRRDATDVDGRAGARIETTATILGWACSCTPFTDHPGTGDPSGPSQAASIAAGRYPLNSNGQPRETSHPGHAGVWDRPKVGPWREYHLDQWRPPPTRPAVVLDCFGGTGTTAMVARALGRDAISVDLSHAYGRAARWRCFDGGEWQQVIERTTGRKARPLPKHNPAQERLL